MCMCSIAWAKHIYYVRIALIIIIIYRKAYYVHVQYSRGKAR